MTSMSKEVAAGHVKRMLDDLRTSAHSTLRSLPGSRESTDGLPAGARFVLWHDVLTSGEHLFVVWVTLDKFMGPAVRAMGGFALTVDGRQRPLTSEEWKRFD